MDTLWTFTLSCIALLVLFDFTNGFHDTANMIASVVASRAMRPGQAIFLISLFTFFGPVFGGTAVADTVGGFVHLADLPDLNAVGVILCGAAGAVTLNFLTWWRGLPSSSSHALVGGLTGSVLIAAGIDHVEWGWRAWLTNRDLQGLTLIGAALFFSPVAGLVMGWLLHHLLRLGLRRATPRANLGLRRLQWFGAAALAFAHGANDAQKTMGVITLVLLLGGFIPRFEVPFWVIVLCATGITLGTASGGWRIIRTVGFGIFRMRPIHAFNSQLAASAVISAGALFGGPVSTTHVVSSCIMGVGAAERPRSVRWGKAGEILFTWLITLPAAGLIAVGYYALLQGWLT
ncbi:MAG: anion permease [Gammaproteobacteria bacterium]